MKKKNDVLKLVQAEIDSIRKRDGVLDKTAYVVLEVVDRLKTVTDWEERDHSKTMAMSIRELVEFCMKNPGYKVPNPHTKIKTIYEDAEPFDYFDPDPSLEVDWDSKDSVQKYSNLSLAGSKKNLVKAARREERKRLKAS